MPDSAPRPPLSLDAAVLQQWIAAAAEKARVRKKTGPVPLPPISVPVSEKRAATLSKRLNKVRSLLEKASQDVRRFDEARNRELRSLHPVRRLGRRNSDKRLARLFARIEQALQSAQAEKASHKPAPAEE
ncbi:hypothetical protein [Roseimicrobium sp. ORNL1]|uniref:hypothetical protein n=1 Tax=Roseimicrobium sp. ORNL1 TaxID=2711231 RepID=UPI0013E15EA5|nr:hypothetical protein [Roseimicrobium sp. ORNL1]QIF02402.1 hypothetical protein G5S37_13000 [Roseimicrobium sp. ORNL1]